MCIVAVESNHVTYGATCKCCTLSPLLQGVEEEVKSSRGAKPEAALAAAPPATADPPAEGAENKEDSAAASAGSNGGAAAAATDAEAAKKPAVVTTKKVTIMTGVAKIKHDPSTVKGELMEGNIDAMEVRTCRTCRSKSVWRYYHELLVVVNGRIVKMVFEK